VAIPAIEQQEEGITQRTWLLNGDITDEFELRVTRPGGWALIALSRLVDALPFKLSELQQGNGKTQVRQDGCLGSG
jgi:hypothetical protein